MPDLAITDLCASYAGRPVLRDVRLTVRTGEVVSVIGPSGSGKSTVLRVLVGLLRPDSGTVALDGQVIDYASTRDIRRLRERCAIVFQQFNLFQNMTVLDNVTMVPVKIRKRERQAAEAAAEALLRKVGLGDKLRAYPDQLSGGQQQRVAIARALALSPEILLLDEVTSALDPEWVSDVLDVVKALAEDGMTMLIVSHEMSFVRRVASRVVFMAEGRVLEEAAPAEFFAAPQTRRAQEFVGRILRY